MASHADNEGPDAVRPILIDVGIDRFMRSHHRSGLVSQRRIRMSKRAVGQQLSACPRRPGLEIPFKKLRTVHTGRIHQLGNGPVVVIAILPDIDAGQVKTKDVHDPDRIVHCKIRRVQGVHFAQSPL